MRRYRLTVDGRRTCHRCDRTLPATGEFFITDKSRSLGLAYECKACHRERKLGRDNRTDRWALMTPEQRAKVSARQKRYAKAKGRPIFQAATYRRFDKVRGLDNDITAQWLRDNIEGKPCAYCGTTEDIGCDRLDNARGHTMDNVVPCCRACNVARMDKFSPDEMALLGSALAEIKRRRDARLSIECDPSRLA